MSNRSGAFPRKSLAAIVCIAILLCASATIVAEPRSVVVIELTYPSGKSPKVFTSGWLFGAKATVGGKDITNEVKWSGTGQFQPPKGGLSRSTFAKAGANTIILSVDYAGEHFSRQFAITAISSEGYAAVGDAVTCHSCAHGCPVCPHSVRGVISRGSPHVQVGGKPAARKGDGGTHAACCGANIFEIVEGDPTVLIDGQPAARKGDKTKHCGGAGWIDGTPPRQDSGRPILRRG